jgi:Ca2+-binding RTX toxin-like protein
MILLAGGDGDDNVQGGSGNDIVSGNAGVNTLTDGQVMIFLSLDQVGETELRTSNQVRT